MTDNKQAIINMSMITLRILIGCEMSGIVRNAFRALGHEAYSCDLLPSLDNSPYHIQGDVLKLLNQYWDAALFYPPCTYLCVSGVHWCHHAPKKPKKDVLYGPARIAATEEAVAFFLKLWAAPIHHIAIENPMSIMSTRLRKSHQTIQPYQFGHPEQKTTNLWLKNLPPLIETNNMYRYMMEVLDVRERERVHHTNQRGENGLTRSEARSLTYPGIAAAKAKQWSEHIINS